jgi:hypothetical protein
MSFRRSRKRLLRNSRINRLGVIPHVNKNTWNSTPTKAGRYICHKYYLTRRSSFCKKTLKLPGTVFRYGNYLFRVSDWGKSILIRKKPRNRWKIIIKSPIFYNFLQKKKHIPSRFRGRIRRRSRKKWAFFTALMSSVVNTPYYNRIWFYLNNCFRRPIISMSLKKLHPIGRINGLFKYPYTYLGTRPRRIKPYSSRLAGGLLVNPNRYSSYRPFMKRYRPVGASFRRTSSRRSDTRTSRKGWGGVETHRYIDKTGLKLGYSSLVKPANISRPSPHSFWGSGKGAGAAFYRIYLGKFSTGARLLNLEWGTGRVAWETLKRPNTYVGTYLRIFWGRSINHLPIQVLNKFQTNLSLVSSSRSSIYLRSRVNKVFLFRNVGLFMVSRFNFFKSQGLSKKFKFRFKKKYFSFLAPNQLKRSILIRKRAIVISRFFTQNKFKLKLRMNPRALTKNILGSFRLFFRNYASSPDLNAKMFYTNLHRRITYCAPFYLGGSDESARYNEVFIPRVRFKPGYQRIWRLARHSLKESLSLRYAYQYRLTRYLTRFARDTNDYYLHFSEASLERLVMYSKLLPDLNTFKVFLVNKLIYVGGRLAFTGNQVLYTNDFVQLIISKWYYVFYRWLTNWTIIRNRKFRRLVYRKGRAAKYKLMKTRKQRSRYTPNWIFNVNYDLTDVKPWLEVDYFTLSLFYIYEPYSINLYPVNDLASHRQNVYRLYNWKYIT